MEPAREAAGIVRGEWKTLECCLRGHREVHTRPEPPGLRLHMAVPRHKCSRYPVLRAHGLGKMIKGWRLAQIDNSM
jgi:hypothetical protein